MTVSEETPPDWYEDNLETCLSKLITANHILHRLKVLDGYGHVSVRSPDNDDTFFISHNVSPALVSSQSDLLEFHVKDGSPVDRDSKIGWSERYGHSEIYKRFPAVNCVIHSHSSDVLPFTVNSVPLKPLIHMAGFLGRCHSITPQPDSLQLPQVLNLTPSTRQRSPGLGYSNRLLIRPGLRAQLQEQPGKP